MSTIQSSETFRPIPRWDGYRVSDWGRVQSCRPKNGLGQLLAEWREVKPVVLGGYRYAHLHSGGGRTKLRRLHILVLEAFVGPRPAGMQCRHLDGNRTNNRLGNLVWGTPKQNCEDRNRHNNDTQGERNGMAKLNAPTVRLIRRLHRDGMPGSTIARELDLGRGCIFGVTKGLTWRHVTI